MINKESLVQIGYFAKPHGVKGEVSLHTDYTELFDEWKEPYLICEMDGLPVPFFVESIRRKNTSVILIKFENINDETAAKTFSHKKAFCTHETIQNYRHETLSWALFTGYLLKDAALGDIGLITDVDESTMNILFQINYRGKELLVPVADDLIITVDHDHQFITVSLPEGLIEL